MVPPGTLAPRAAKRRGTAPASSDAGFKAAVALHVAGDLTGAERAYRRFLIDAPRHAAAHNNLGSILATRDELGAALACYATAAELDANYGEAFHNFGLVLTMIEQPAEAIAPLEQAVRLEPRRVNWWRTLGNARTATGDHDGAVAAYDRALALDAADATTLANRAVALRCLGRYNEAIANSEAALDAEPRAIDVWTNLGTLHREVRNFAASLAALHRAMAVDPAHGVAVTEIANTLAAMNRLPDARRAAEWATAEFDALPQAWSALAMVAFEQGDYEAARTAFASAMALRPDDASVNWNLAILELLCGEFREGLARFEHRKRIHLPGERRRAQLPPEWDGTPMHGARVVVLAEQGLGDQIHFARYIPALKQCGASHVTVECAGPVRSLFALLPGIDAFIAPDAPLPEADLHVRLMGLALRLGTTLDTVPLGDGYLRAPVRPAAERARALPGPRVGIVWAGNPSHSRDGQRSMPLDALREVLAIPGVTFVSLQKGGGDALTAYPQVHDLARHDADLGDTAAVIAELDLVIAIDSAIAHVAGALGTPVWCALSHVPDWRWRIDRDDTPWYSSMRLLRQPTRGDWPSVVGAIADGVRALAAGQSASSIRPQVHAPDAVRADTPSARARPGAGLRSTVSIGWQVGATTGWGTYGLHLCRHLVRSSRAAPILAQEPMTVALTDADRAMLDALPRAVGAEGPAAVHLAGLGNQLRGAAPIFTSQHNAGVIFLEDTALDGAASRRARGFDQLVAGSTWNEALLRSIGHPRVTCVWQGVDPALFHPAARNAQFGERFVIFSGGKLEFRKGQDLVVAAFRIFRSRHPEALLVTAWHNHWAEWMAGIDAAGHVRGVPALVNGRLEVTRWLVDNGVPADAVHDLGVRSQAEIATILHGCDVALFPNRAEGGTNLVAMEAMACGVPSIVAANTGQLDLLTPHGAIVLAEQGRVTPNTMVRGTDGWGESSVDEMVEALERCWQDRAWARARGLAGAAHVGTWTWARQAEMLLDAVLPG